MLGKLAHEAGDRAKAIEHLDRAIELHPPFFSAWQERGSIMGEQRQFVEAERCFREVLRLNPSSFRIHHNLAIVLRQTGRKGEAERSLRKSLAWNPNFAGAWTEFGNLLLETERYALAIEAYQRAIRLGATIYNLVFKWQETL